MSRDIMDIPEAFRRAFEEDDGRRRGEGGDDGGQGPGNGGRSGRPWWTNRWLWISFLVLAFLLSFNWIVLTYTEWLWLTALDYQTVWLTQWSIRLAVFVIFFILGAFIIILNWRLAFKNARKIRNTARIRILELPGLSWLINGTGLFLAFVFASAAGTQWERVLLYLNRQPFGINDPIFNRDVSFYLFELPIFRFVQGWLLPLFIITLLGTAGIYMVDNWSAVQRGRWPLPTDQLTAFRQQVAVVLTVIFLLMAAGLFLDIFDLLYSPRGVAFGASYTDLKASLPALYVQIVLVILLALTTAYNFFRQSLRLPIIAGALWVAAALLIGNVYPAIIQRYEVEPNEISRERPFIEHNIEFTRAAFGLDKIEVREFGDVTELSEADLQDNDATLRNIRVWDYRPLQQTYAQLQALRPYYEFSSIDIDRVEVDGEIRQVMLAARELNKAQLQNRTWVNEKLEFTHGYGIVMNPVDQVTPDGRPAFFVQDLPPQSSIDLAIERPEIYYGELIDDVVFVGSGLEEFDYPTGSDNAYSSYTGEGGVVLSNLLRRLAFAIRFGETNLLLSEFITPQTRVLLHRQIRERVMQITPFLTLDYDPYIVVADGRLVWMLDAYTISNEFPYSTPINKVFGNQELRLNYIRNSVKITIDAYDGTVNYYLVDDQDPIIKAYAQAFPNLFKPFEEMPASIQSHVRYPEDLFIVQTRQFLSYHMTDVQVFYNQEDLWEIAQVRSANNDSQPIEPYYVVFNLPGETEPEYLLIEPYTPANRNNMIAWLAARNDPEHYGELIAYELPKQELVFGPLQIEARIDQDPEISAQLSLWNQRGSSVIRGNLLVLPMNRSFLYVEPIYLQAETSQLPELARIIVASGERLVMRETLSEALIALIEGAPSVDTIVEEPPVTEPAEETAEPGETTEEPTAAPPATDATVEELIQSANEHFEAAEAAQRSGDWTTYGRELEALQQDLERLMELTGEGG
jgi:uncharacterized membrane protein (UPF0182 family)